ncbi:MAG TPA: L-ribulose-5-phosphate 4-epimerase AraD [Kofleriaceae bacterium]|nr:L-ribulose-5-phosphate 4-epimerase AraD [Kofleriaceae bacterium]
MTAAGHRELRERVLAANLELPRRGLALYTFGNASELDPAAGVLAIKPSGVPYDRLGVDDIVVLDLEGRVLAGTLRPSSDTRTHIALYRAYAGEGVRGIVHTHSTYATAWAQARRPIPIYGTTHADYLAGDVPCTVMISDDALAGDYEAATGDQIVACVPASAARTTPMVLVAGHGPFTWGSDATAAIYHAAMLEQIAHMAFVTQRIDPAAPLLPERLIHKHFDRKHGTHAYYGQK